MGVHTHVNQGLALVPQLLRVIDMQERLQKLGEGRWRRRYQRSAYRGMARGRPLTDTEVGFPAIAAGGAQGVGISFANFPSKLQDPSRHCDVTV